MGNTAVRLRVPLILAVFIIFNLTDNSTPSVSSPSSGIKLQIALEKNQAEVIRFSPWELVTEMAWSPDGRILAIAAGNKIYLYQASIARQIGAIEMNALTPGLEFSPDGGRLAAGSRDGIVRLWDVADLVGSADNFAFHNASPIWEVPAHQKGVNDLVFSPDGKLLASSGNDGLARIWDVSQGVQVSQIIGGAFAVPALDFSPDGKTLAIMNERFIRLREVSSGRITGTIRADTPLYSLKFSPNGLILAASDHDNGVLLWDPSLAYRTGVSEYPKPVRLIGHNGKSGSARALVWRVDFSPDGSLLASAGGDMQTLLWNVTDGKLLKLLSGHTRAVTCLSFSPDGSRLASGSLDGTVRIWTILNN